MKWERKTINELCEIKGGKRLPKNHELIEVETNHPYIRARDIGNGIIDFSKPVYLQENTFNFISRYTVKADDIVLTIVGANIGDVGLIPKHLDGANLTENAVKLTSFNENCHFKYLLYYFLLPGKKKQLEQVAAGSAQGKLGLYKIKDIEVPIPPLPTQRKIASILSAYDDLIENNLKRIKLLEEKAQLHYIQYKPIEKIALQDIADYLGRGVTPKYEEGSGFYAINQKANKGSLLEYSQFKSLDSKLEVPDDKFAKWGDLLINSLGEGTLGRVHFYTDKSDLYAVDQHMSIFRTQKQHYTFYLYQFLSSNYGQGLLDSLKKGGTNMTMLNISDLRQLIVSFPSEKELIELWNVCKPLFQLKQTLITQNTKLREARDILLPKLMNGQIEV